MILWLRRTLRRAVLSRAVVQVVTSLVVFVAGFYLVAVLSEMIQPLIYR